jgi:hypothetical protein
MDSPIERVRLSEIARRHNGGTYSARPTGQIYAGSAENYVVPELCVGCDSAVGNNYAIQNGAFEAVCNQCLSYRLNPLPALQFAIRKILEFRREARPTLGSVSTSRRSSAQSGRPSGQPRRRH